LRRRGHYVETVFISRPDLSFFRKVFGMRDLFDVIHTNYSFLYPLLFIANVLHGIPVVETVHGIPQPWLEPSLLYKIGYQVEGLFLRPAGRLAEVVVSVSNYVRKRLLEVYGIDSMVIYNGIDFSEIVIFDEKEREEYRRRFGLSGFEKVILFVGKMHPCKNPLMLLEAFEQVCKEYRDVCLVMAGGGELLRKVKAVVRRRGLDKQVMVCGEVSRSLVEVFYNVSDVFVLPSLSEAFGYAVIEAMAHGLPLVVSRSGALPEIVKDAGLYVDPLDVCDIADKLLRVLTEEDLAKRFGERAKVRAKSFSIDDTVARYLEIYQEVL